MSAIVTEADRRAAHEFMNYTFGGCSDSAIATAQEEWLARRFAKAREAENRACEARVTDHLVCRGPCRCDDNWCNGVRGISDAIAARRDAQPVKVPG